MKSFNRLGLCFALLAAFFVIVPVSFAQDANLGLNDDDFALWQSANESLASYETLSSDYTAMIEIRGIQPILPANTRLNLTGTALLDSSGSYGLTLNGTAESEALTADGVGPTVSVDVNVEWRFIGDMFYVRAGDGEWQGGVISEAFNSFTALMRSASAGVPFDPSAPVENDAIAEINHAIETIVAVDPAGYLTVTSSSADGLTQYALAVMVSQLASDPSVLALASESAASPNGQPASMTMTGLITQILNGLSFGTLTLSEVVDPADNQIKRGVFNYSLPLGEAGVSITVDAAVTSYNQPITIEAPADYAPLDMVDILAMLGASEP